MPAKLFYHSGTADASHQVCRGNPDEKASEQHQDPPERRSADDDKPHLVKYSEMIGVHHNGPWSPVVGGRRQGDAGIRETSSDVDQAGGNHYLFWNLERFWFHVEIILNNIILVIF